MRQGLYGAFIGPLDSWDQFFVDKYCKGERATGAEHSWLLWENYIIQIEHHAEDVFELGWVIKVAPKFIKSFLCQ